MIPFDFEYYRPDSIAGALEVFQRLDAEGKQPVYYGGGTEIISMGRMSNISTGAVIDLKNIDECKMQVLQGEELIIGSSVTLTQVHEANLFPLLAHAAARVADHTIQNKITLGGNLCGTIIYKEAVLPLLLADSSIMTAGPEGERTTGIKDLFQKQMQLKRGEFIVKIIIDKKYLECPYVHVKQTKQDKINYPLVTICAISDGGGIRTAFSGVCDYPFRSIAMEAELNNTTFDIEQRINKAIDLTPEPISDNLEGSAGYRRFILHGLLSSIVNKLEGWHVSNAG